MVDALNVPTKGTTILFEISQRSFLGEGDESVDSYAKIVQHPALFLELRIIELTRAIQEPER